MVEPVTIGSLVALALGWAAEATLKGAVGEAVKDGYKALKDKISGWAGSDVTALEAPPTSTARQTVIAEIIDARSEGDRQALRVLAETLIAALKTSAPAIGLDLGRLTDVEVKLGTITVTSGIGARIADASGGKIEMGDISVGPPPGK